MATNPYIPFDSQEAEAIKFTIKFIRDTKADLDEKKQIFEESIKDQKEKLEAASAWLQTKLLGEEINASGTFHFGDENGISATYEVKKEYKIDAKALETLILKSKLDGEIAQKIIEWKPQVIAKEYKALDEDTLKILSSAITTELKKPTFKVEVKGE